MGSRRPRIRPRGASLAENYEAVAVPFDDLGSTLARVDVVVCATDGFGVRNQGAPVTAQMAALATIVERRPPNFVGD